MAKSELDDFLNGEGEPAPDAVEELLGVPSAPDKPTQEPKAEPEPEPDDDTPPTSPDGRTVPLAALEAERAQRRDWKIEATKAQTERDELRKQLDEAKRYAQQPPPQPQYQEPPRERTYEEQRAFDEVNNRLNFSEMAARDKHGDEVIEAAIEEFKKAVEINPSLVTVLHQQVHPYSWLVKEVEGLRLKREIGNDPAAYKARLRAEWEAERGATQEAPQQQQISPAARLAPSLANARSAAPRGAPAYTGPTDLDEILRR